MGLDVFESIRATRPGNACDWLEQSVIATLGDGLGAMNGREGPASTDGIAPPPDALIVQARQAACGPGEAETQVRQRELRARTLLRSAHKRLDEAAAREAQAEMRVRAAEERLRVVEARAAARVEAAEARARRAEEAARSALAWLQRLQPAEFGGGPAAAQPPGLRRVA